MVNNNLAKHLRHSCGFPFTHDNPIKESFGYITKTTETKIGIIEEVYFNNELLFTLNFSKGLLFQIGGSQHHTDTVASVYGNYFNIVVCEN